MSVVGKRYTLINVCEELSGDKVTSIVFHGYREVVSAIFHSNRTAHNVDFQGGGSPPS